MQYTVINCSSDYISAFLLKFDEGIKFAKTVVAMGDEKELSSRGYLALGMGYSLLASEGNVLVVLGSTLSREWGNGSEQFMTLSNTSILTGHYSHSVSANRVIRTHDTPIS